MPRLARSKDMTKHATMLYMALELGGRKWKLAFSDGGTKERVVTVAAGEMEVVRAAVGKAKEKYRLPPGVASSAATRRPATGSGFTGSSWTCGSRTGSWTLEHRGRRAPAPGKDRSP